MFRLIRLLALLAFLIQLLAAKDETKATGNLRRNLQSVDNPGIPTSQPSTRPTDIARRTRPTSQPTGRPSKQPTTQPTCQPTTQPSHQPTRSPTNQPTTSPTSSPSIPTYEPTAVPSIWVGLYPPGCDPMAAQTCEDEFQACKLYQGDRDSHTYPSDVVSPHHMYCLCLPFFR